MSVNELGNVVEIGWLGTADWSPDTPILVHSIQFISSSIATDIYVVKNISAVGPEIFRYDNQHRDIKYFPNSLMRPYIDISEDTLSCESYAKLVIIKQEEERF